MRSSRGGIDELAASSRETVEWAPLAKVKRLCNALAPVQGALHWRSRAHAPVPRHDLFRRRDVAPNRIINTLLGKSGVRSLDGDARHHGKAMFRQLMAPERLLEFRRLLLIF